jgi:hypothetical protein
MIRGRSRKRHQSSRKGSDENDHSQQDKVKRLLLLQLDAQVPEEEDQKSLQFKQPSPNRRTRNWE